MKLRIAAIDIYLYDYTIIGHMILHIVAAIFLKNSDYIRVYGWC